ncbi:serine/threonine-protein kinase [Cognatiyoonia sp. IB215182]|uniref:serine/threonine protein kinase n=1 Tax=Cognatiyoonia sp. IB215182 TaxID=3097353 RepID=UPI002A0C2DDB|nr:serine/threonine-protein kinase [Cognatiyoonia sp. IB215182]MDX8351824.1 serine/threonine-protein kinase [Cognatiyoonia sp. IB215182]
MDFQSVVHLFLKEARSLAKLDHPNIVGVHQIFEEHGTAYMALDYVHGSDLLGYITEPEKHLSPTQIRTLLGKVLDAVRFVHDAGLLHRDISPDNIIVTKTLEPILIDFGAAREQATQAKQALSALPVVKDGYSPQEFYLAGSTQGSSSDLYSLAATFYHLIAGETPPDSQMRVTLHVTEQIDPYVPLGQRTKDFDETFCAAIDRALAILPQDRLQSAAEWQRLLQIKPSKNKTGREPEEGAGPLHQTKWGHPIRSQTVAINRPRRASHRNKGLRRHITALLTGSTAVLVLVGGSCLTPGDNNAATAGPMPTTRVAIEARSIDAATPVQQVANAEIFSIPAEITAEITSPQPSAPTLSKSWAEGLIALNWRTDWSFTIGPDPIVKTGTPSVPTGARIMAIDGESVQTRAQVEAGIAETAGRPYGTIAPVNVTSIGLNGGDKMMTELPFKIIYHTAFDNGLAFETRFVDDAWLTKVVGAPPAAIVRCGSLISKSRVNTNRPDEYPYTCG